MRKGAAPEEGAVGRERKRRSFPDSQTNSFGEHPGAQSVAAASLAYTSANVMGLRTLPASRAGRPACSRRIRPWRISRILQLILLVQSILFLHPHLLLPPTHPPP